MADLVEVYVANDAEWQAYKQKFNKSYHPSEEAQKRKTWEETIVEVNKHNEEYRKGNQSYSMAVNQFADGSRPACCGVRHH